MPTYLPEQKGTRVYEQELKLSKEGIAALARLLELVPREDLERMPESIRQLCDFVIGVDSKTPATATAMVRYQPKTMVDKPYVSRLTLRGDEVDVIMGIVEQSDGGDNLALTMRNWLQRHVGNGREVHTDQNNLLGNN